MVRNIKPAKTAVSSPSWKLMGGGGGWQMGGSLKDVKLLHILSELP